MIKTARLVRGWTQKDLARLIGCSAGVVSKWECAKTKPSLELAKKLSSLLDISMTDLGYPLHDERVIAESYSIAIGDFERDMNQAIMRALARKRQLHDRFTAGQKVKVNISDDGRVHNRMRTGKIVQKYQRFALVDFRYYKSCFFYDEMIKC